MDCSCNSDGSGTAVCYQSYSGYLTSVPPKEIDPTYMTTCDVQDSQTMGMIEDRETDAVNALLNAALQASKAQDETLQSPPPSSPPLLPDVEVLHPETVPADATRQRQDKVEPKSTAATAATTSDPRMTASATIVDMLTDVREEQVTTEEVVASAGQSVSDIGLASTSTTDPLSCYVPRNVSSQPSVITTASSLVKPTVSLKVIPHSEHDSDESFTDDSDEDGSEMSDNGVIMSPSQFHPEMMQTSVASDMAMTASLGDGSSIPAAVISTSMSQWSSASLQRQLSDSYASASNTPWSLSSGLLAGVIPSAGPLSGAYYQQQVCLSSFCRTVISARKYNVVVI